MRFITSLLRTRLLLPVLVVILLATIGLNRLANTWHYVIPSEPGALLYTATFDDLVDDWQQYQGRLSAEVRDSKLQINAGAVQSGPYSAANPYFGDFDLRVQAQPIAGPLDNGYGVIFRLQDPFNYYLFLISSDGFYQVSRVVNGVEKVMSTWIESPLINQGVADGDNPGVSVNWIRVVARGEHYQFLINDQPVQLCIPSDPNAESTVNPMTNECIGGAMIDSLTDATFTSGQLGVVAKSLAEPGVIVNFDNVLVFGPEAASA